MIYSPGNSAKQWILSDIEKRSSGAPLRIFDLACGQGWVWEKFMETHPAVKIIGFDTDGQAIQEGRKRYAGKNMIDLRIFDAQQTINEEPADAVVALSAMEHVFDRPAFLRTVWQALKPGGVAYLNYDAGHFRSRNLKERIMVPLSQLLAKFGKEHWYMKQVNDSLLYKQIKAQGFQLLKIRKHNLHPLKGFMRGAPPPALVAWFEFEEKLGELYPPEVLDRIMWSTTFVVQRI